MTEQVYGADMVPKIDRDVEDAQIRNQPPAAVGNPRGTSLVEQLKARFKGYDEQRLGKIRLNARNGAPVWLELDLDISEDELKVYREKAKGGNRAARRNRGGQEQGDVSLALVTARILNDRNTRVWFDDPAEGGKPLTDAEGDPLTVYSEEWLAITGSDDPVAGLRALFGDWTLIDGGEDYMELAGVGEGSEIVNPTSGSSGD